MATAPSELTTLRGRMAELIDLGAVSSLLFWDQNTMMPHGAAAARADQAGSLERVLHERLTDPEVGRLLDALAPWAAGEDPESVDVRLLHWVRRDYEKATRVPTDLAVELTHAAALGEQAWLEARAASDSAASATRSRATSSSSTATSPASRGSRTPTTRCSTTSSPS